MIRRIFILVLVVTGVFITTVAYAPQPNKIYMVHRELLYEGIWGTIYHAEVRQCDDTPTITGSGYKIDPSRASDLRIIAISQGMLYDMNRRSMIDTTVDNRFNGKIAYGDTVWIESPKDTLGNYLFPHINGYWVVHDSKNKRYEMSIDFLQTKNDGTLYNNDPLWSGKINDIKIYSSNT